MDAQVTNGGFIQFYLNGYGKYTPPILDGLRLIGDEAMIGLVQDAEAAYFSNEQRFQNTNSQEQAESLYEELMEFEELDNRYYDHHENTMKLLEAYARNHVRDFGRLV